jgi:hypothetical protein
VNVFVRNDIRGITDLDDILDWLEYDSDTADINQIQKKCDELFNRYGLRVDPINMDQGI